MTTTREISWRATVEAADDKDRQKDSLHPVVYYFSGGQTRRDSGPDGGPYKQDD